MEQETILDNINDNFEQQETLSDKDIFTKIWTAPRKVFKYINDNHYDKYVLMLLLLAGISSTFAQAVSKHLGDQMSILGVFGFCILIGGLIGWASYFIFAALTSWTGKWLKGEGNTQSILRIMSYASIPSVAALLLLILQIAVYGNEIFKSGGDTISAGLMSNMVFYLSLLLEFGLGIWTLVLCVIGISIVQKFSIGKSILNMLLPVLVLFAIVFLLMLLMVVFK